MAEREPTRRTALRRGLLFLGGLVGIGAATRVASTAPAATHAAGDGATAVREVLSFCAQHLQVHVGGRRATRMPDSGEPAAAHAELVDAGGRRIGEIHVAVMPVHGPGMASADTGAMEWHTFHLDGGTIIGSGSAGTEGGAFAVVGGTGRFAGARGTYTLRRGGELGADAAEFVLQLSL
jgi:hypothetical protein